MKLPDKGSIASFDVDAQCTFTPICPDELPVEGGDEIVEELNAQARPAGWRVGSKDAHSPQAVWVTEDPDKFGQPGVEGPNVEEHWPVHAVPGTRGFELLPGLPAPIDYDFFVWKGVELDLHPNGACFHDLAETRSTGIIEWLRARGVSHVIVGGLATDVCVRATALQLNDNGFKVILNQAACRGITPASTRQALAEMQDKGVRLVANAAEIENASGPVTG